MLTILWEWIARTYRLSPLKIRPVCTWKTCSLLSPEYFRDSRRYVQFRRLFGISNKYGGEKKKMALQITLLLDLGFLDKLRRLLAYSGLVILQSAGTQPGPDSSAAIPSSYTAKDISTLYIFLYSLHNTAMHANQKGKQPIDSAATRL